MLDSTSVIVFFRLLGLVVIAPVWGQAEITPMVKMLLILCITSAISCLVPQPVVLPATPVAWIVQCGMEVGMGLFLGLIGRIILVVLDMVGNIISFQMGLSFSLVMNPTMQSETTLPSNILTRCGVVLMLALNMHHIFLRGVVQSYSIHFSLGEGAQHLLHTMQLLFSSALRLSMPFLALHVFLQVTMGLFNRFVPSFSFFNLSIPAQLWGGLVVLLATAAAILNEFAGILELMWPH